MGLCTARMSSDENVASLFRQTFELALDSLHLQNPPVVDPHRSVSPHRSCSISEMMPGHPRPRISLKVVSCAHMMFA